MVSIQDLTNRKGSSNQRPRVIILAGAASYRRQAFREAGSRLEIELLEVADIPESLDTYAGSTIGVDYNSPERAAEVVAKLAQEAHAAAIVALDDTGTLVAAEASQRASLPYNEPDSALAARDKLVMRRRLRAAGEPVPWFQDFPVSTEPQSISNALSYPVVVKPTLLSGSRGVIRANDEGSFVAAFERTRSLVLSEGGSPTESVLLVEEYLPGVEVAVEAIMTNGQLHVLSIFDKPDPLEGPFFEETIYVTPSRLSAATQHLIHERTTGAATALGIRQGPVHAELRIDGDRIVIIEMAGRSIGGLCSTILEFGAGRTLEELILLNAVGRFEKPQESNRAVGVMMIPIPKSGVLRCVHGIEAARNIEGVTGVQITAQLNTPISALPEGSSYLGFIFAAEETPELVEETLRRAHGQLDIRIERLIPLRKLN